MTKVTETEYYLIPPPSSVTLFQSEIVRSCATASFHPRLDWVYLEFCYWMVSSKSMVKIDDFPIVTVAKVVLFDAKQGKI